MTMRMEMRMTMRMRMTMTMRMRMTITIWKKNIKDWLDEIIDKTESFQDQIKSLKKVKNLEPWFINDYGDKELKFKIFKLRLAHSSNIIDEKLFEQIFGLTLEALANKIINTTNKEENQITVNDIKKNKDKLYEKDETNPLNNYVINLIDAVNLILDFNKTI